MDIQVEQQIVLPGDKEYKWESTLTRAVPLKGVISIVTFNVFDKLTGRSSKKILTFSGAAHNKFWDDYTSGVAIYSMLIERENLSAAISDDLELEFKNK